jgi:hypothetical protein
VSAKPQAVFCRNSFPPSFWWHERHKSCADPSAGAADAGSAIRGSRATAAQTAKLSDADYQKLTYPERIAYAAKFSQRSVQAPATPTAAEWAAMSPQARADFDRARSDALAKGYTAGGVGVDVEDAMNLRPRLDTLELRLSYLFGL